MPWCPVCKNEYREGIKFCADCQAELVEKLEEESESGPDEAEALRASAVVMFESGEAFPEDEIDGAPTEKPAEYQTYHNSAVQAEDNRTSAYTLFFVGILGFVLDILVFMNVVPVFRSADTTRYFVCGIMGAMFILFIVFGVVSMRNSKILLVQAKSEDTLLSELQKWCRENLQAEQIDAGLFDEDMPEEQKYFKRADKMKEIINNKFLNLDQGLLSHFVDEYYQELFESE